MNAKIRGVARSCRKTDVWGSDAESRVMWTSARAMSVTLVSAGRGHPSAAHTPGEHEVGSSRVGGMTPDILRPCGVQHP